MSELPQLLDAKALRSALGVTRAAAEAIMRQLPIVEIDELRKVYVRRSDVAAYLEARTFTAAQRGSTIRERCRDTAPLQLQRPGEK